MMVEVSYFEAAREERDRRRDGLTGKKENREEEKGLGYLCPSKEHICALTSSHQTSCPKSSSPS